MVGPGLYGFGIGYAALYLWAALEVADVDVDIGFFVFPLDALEPCKALADPDTLLFPDASTSFLDPLCSCSC